MKRLTLGLLAPFAAMAATPASAQSAEDLNCAVDRSPDWMAEALMADYLFTAGGIGEGTTQPFRETIMSLAVECAQELGLPEESVDNYAQYSVTVFMEPTASELLAGEGVDLAQIDESVAYHLQGEPPELSTFVTLVTSDIVRELQGEPNFEYVGRLMAIYALSEYVQRDFLATYAQ